MSRQLISRHKAPVISCGNPPFPFHPSTLFKITSRLIFKNFFICILEFEISPTGQAHRVSIK